MVIRGSGLAPRVGPRPNVYFGEADAGLMLVTENRVIVRVPDGASDGTVRVANGNGESAPHPVSIGLQIADNLHPIGNPAVDLEGNIYVTFSGPRGEPVPVSLYKVTANYNVKPFVTTLVNPSGLALDRFSNLYVSCRHDGTIHKITPEGRAEQWIEGMGIAQTWEEMSRIHAALKSDGRLTRLRAEQSRRWFWNEVQAVLSETILSDTALAARATELEADVVGGNALPYAAARALISQFHHGRVKPGHGEFF